MIELVMTWQLVLGRICHLPYFEAKTGRHAWKTTTLLLATPYTHLNFQAVILFTFLQLNNFFRRILLPSLGKLMKWLQKIIRNQCDSRKSAFTKLLEEGSREVSSKYGVPHVVTGVVLEKHPHQGKTSLAPRFLYNKGGQKDESSHSSWLKTYGEDTMNDASLMHWVDVKSCTYKYRHLQEIKVNIYHGYPHRISPQGSPILFFCKDESCSFQFLQDRTFGACFFCTSNQPVWFTKRPHGQQEKTYCTLITTHAYFTCDAQWNAHVWSFYPKKMAKLFYPSIWILNSYWCLAARNVNTACKQIRFSLRLWTHVTNEQCKHWKWIIDAKHVYIYIHPGRLT